MGENYSKKKITITKPFLPPLAEYQDYLQDIWDRKWITNNGFYHQELEAKLADFLGVKHVSLFSNGTLALIIALRALDIQGDVITTPYSFVATSYALWWNRNKARFIDVDPTFGNLEPNLIEPAITKSTEAILPVHVYGNPCNIEQIQEIAKRNKLKVIYDAAHAFGMKYNNQSILNYGDLSILSFHATKVYHTFEGGAIISHNAAMKKKIDDLKNFGFQNETSISSPGINSKMNELQASMGLLQLKYFRENLEKRKKIAYLYYELLGNVKGIRILKPDEQHNPNYGYLPIFIQPEYPIDRDSLYHVLKKNDILARRYFYPLITEFPPYDVNRDIFNKELFTAKSLAETVICLPLYSELEINEIELICKLIRGEYQ